MECWRATTEMRVAMTLIGAADISQISRDVLDLPRMSTTGRSPTAAE